MEYKMTILVINNKGQYNHRIKDNTIIESKEVYSISTFHRN